MLEHEFHFKPVLTHFKSKVFWDIFFQYSLCIMSWNPPAPVHWHEAKESVAGSTEAWAPQPGHASFLS